MTEPHDRAAQFRAEIADMKHAFSARVLKRLVCLAGAERVRDHALQHLRRAFELISVPGGLVPAVEG